MNRRRADLALIGNTVIWGATFTLVKTAIGSVSPILFLALRFSLATAALAVFFRFRGGSASRSPAASFEAAGKPPAERPRGPLPPGTGSVPSRARRAPREGDPMGLRPTKSDEDAFTGMGRTPWSAAGPLASPPIIFVAPAVSPPVSFRAPDHHR